MAILFLGSRRRALLCGLMLVASVPWSLAHAARAISEKRPADPQGTVEIFCLAGSIEVAAWDRPEIEVTGTVDDGVERVEVAGSGDRTSIRVLPRGAGGSAGGGTQLTIHVPVKSSVSTTLVGADLKIAGVQGDAKLQTISGNVVGDVGGDLRVNSVTGSVRMSALHARTIEAKTISGGIHLAGGNAEVEVTTVSGSATIRLGTLARGRFRTVSGSMSAKLALAPGARLDGESVSGRIDFEFAAVPEAEFDIQSFSGSIDSCFGPKPTEPRYGPGSRLTFKSGDGSGRVHIDTQSGGVRLCTQDLHQSEARGHAKTGPVNDTRPQRANPFYLI